MLFLWRVWIWVKKHWKIVVGVLATVTVTIVYVLGRNNFKNEVLLKDRKEIQKKKIEIAVLEAKKEMVKSGISQTSEDVKKIDEDILAHRQELMGVKRKIKDMKLEDRLKKFKDLGY